MIIGGIIIIIIVIILMIVLNVKNNNKIMEENSNIIRTNYESLSSLVNDYNDVRAEYLKLSETLYYDNFLDFKR